MPAPTISPASRQLLIDLLHAEQCACVIRNGDTIRLGRQRGVKDLFELLKREPDLLAGAFVADKVVGKGAAALLIAGGVAELWADRISEAALELLRTSPVRVAYGASTPCIVNRDGTGICPVEALCSDCRTAAECLPRIEAFVARMAQQQP